MAKFAGQLGSHIKQAGLSLRQIASQAGIPHQTLHNWLMGRQPRWHDALPRDLGRLGAALSLADIEINYLIRLAVEPPRRPGWHDGQEVLMTHQFRIPKGWVAGGDAPEKYEMGLDPSVRYDNRPCVTILAGPDPAEFGALSQTVKAEAYRGKRLRFSAAVRADGIENMAALFMRVGGPQDQILAFDNMRNRPICGSQDWTQHSVVLDVAEQAESIIFGMFLSLKGQVWMADVHLEAVGTEVPATDIAAEILEEILHEHPVNLELEE